MSMDVFSPEQSKHTDVQLPVHDKHIINNSANRFLIDSQYVATITESHSSSTSGEEE